MDVVGVVGLGYVGLQSALLAASSGYRVVGVDLNAELIRRLSEGKPVLMERFVLENWRDDILSNIEFTTSYQRLKDANIVLVAVQTPIRNCKIDYSPLKLAGEELAKVVSRGVLIVNESTIYPGGTIEFLGHPIEKQRGWKVGKDFYLAHCPERVNPGDNLYTMKNIPRVLGAADPESLSLAAKYYRSLGLRITEVNSIEIAELSKLLENTYRFLNISYVNELKRLTDKTGIPIREVIEASTTKPFGFHKHFPGPGVGGACLPKDTLMLMEYARKSGFRISILEAAWQVNTTQPQYYADLLDRIAREINAKKILFYGYAYKPGGYSDYLSPVKLVGNELEKKGYAIRFYDPKLDGEAEDDLLKWPDLVVTWGYNISNDAGIVVVDLTKL